MPAAFDHEGLRTVDHGPHIVAFDRERRQCGCDVEGREGSGRRHDVVARRLHLRRQPVENFDFESERTVGRAHDLRFQFAEFGGGEADLTGQRLAMDETRIERCGHQLVAVLRRDLDEIAEHIVVPDLEDADAGLLGIAGLQLRDHLARAIAQRSRLVECAVIALADEAAVAPERRQFVTQRCR